MSTVTIAKFIVSTRTDITLQKNVKWVRAITMCSAFTPDCGYDKSTVSLIGDVYCPKTKCLGKFCLHKKTFPSLGRREYQCPQCRSVSQVHNILFEDQINFFFLSFGQGVSVSGESPKSIRDVIGAVYCPGKYCFHWEKCESLDDYVTTPTPIHGFGKSVARLFTKFLLFYKST